MKKLKYVFTFSRFLVEISLIYFFVFTLPIGSVRADCLIYRNTDKGTKETDLLKLLKPLQGMTFEVNDVVNSNYSYKVRICDHVEGSEGNVSAVQYTKSGDKFNLGRYNMTDIMGGTDWILLTYYGGDVYHNHCNNASRVARIMIICDPDNLRGKFEILEERKSSQANCYYLFELGSKVSCTVKSHKLSSGSVFCILFFTVLAVYLICGFLYKRIVIGAKGLEQIPNYTFWREFGNLQADGCDYLCRWGLRHETQAYRGIDDHLKVDEERDDQLLNM